MCKASKQAITELSNTHPQYHTTIKHLKHLMNLAVYFDTDEIKDMGHTDYSTREHVHVRKNTYTQAHCSCVNEQYSVYMMVASP